ncbi:MAG TPA: DUF3306 domain-containing protein [Usitatibacter sp.]|nr:DUF3306 domain-containing protein [Usitatibacter sp.]
MSQGDEHFLARWSRRKREAKHAAAETPAPALSLDGSARPAVPLPAPPVEVQPGDSPQPQPQPLPALDSLTPDSDFTPFMQAEVDPGVRRQALKTLFQDPQFNVMDGLDVYIDDYSKPDPLPEGWLAKMTQVARLGAYVEPVAAEEKEAGEALAENTQAALLEPASSAIEVAPSATQPPPSAAAHGEGDAQPPEGLPQAAAGGEPPTASVRKTADDS